MFSKYCYVLTADCTNFSSVLPDEENNSLPSVERKELGIYSSLSQAEHAKIQYQRFIPKESSSPTSIYKNLSIEVKRMDTIEYPSNATYDGDFWPGFACVCGLVIVGILICVTSPEKLTKA